MQYFSAEQIQVSVSVWCSFILKVSVLLQVETRLSLKSSLMIEFPQLMANIKS